MASVLPTLLDIAKANGVELIVEEALTACPELNYIGFDDMPGTSYKTMVRTSVPQGGFRGANEGVNSVASTWENRVVESFIFNPRWECDKAVADAYPKGAEYYIALEGLGISKGGFKSICTQMYYGVTSPGDAKGFPGLIAAVDDTQVVDATGTTANTGSSVWAVKFGELDVNGLLGGNGSFELSETRIGDVTDANSKRFTAYIQEILSWIGLKVNNKYCVSRIKNLTADNGKGLTDSLISQLYEKIPVEYKPDAFFMSRRSRGQLQRSRTATTPTGAIAPLPTEWEGIPIVATDNILNTEAIA